MSERRDIKASEHPGKQATERLCAPATQRNREAILDVLRSVLPPRGNVLEIASGTGEHITWFAQLLPALVFQPSDPDPRHRASIAAWTEFFSLSNVRVPLALDVRTADWTLPGEMAGVLDAILCINMIHIAPWEATLGLMRGASALLADDAPLYLYGPYKRAGRHTAPSNAAFDQSLRAQDPSWGVRDLEAVADIAKANGLDLTQIVEMPANNLSVVFRKR